MVAPVLQVNVPLQPAAVNVTFSLPHTGAGVDGVTTGATGAVPFVIVTSFDLPLIPQAVVHVAK